MSTYMIVSALNGMPGLGSLRCVVGAAAQAAPSVAATISDHACGLGRGLSNGVLAWRGKLNDGAASGPMGGVRCSGTNKPLECESGLRESGANEP